MRLFLFLCLCVLLGSDAFPSAYKAYEDYKKILREPIKDAQEIDRLRIRAIKLNNIVKLGQAVQGGSDAFKKELSGYVAESKKSYESYRLQEAFEQKNKTEHKQRIRRKIQA